MSHRDIDQDNGEMRPDADVPAADADPHAIGNAKWLNELSQHPPGLDEHPRTPRRLGFDTGDLVRVTTEIGHFVARVWVTEAIRPGVVGLLPPHGPLAALRRTPGRAG